MPYVTAIGLRDATSNQELAQVATPREYRAISAEQMRRAIDGEDYSNDPDAPVIALALARVTRAVQDASDFLDNYMRLRYVVPLLSPPRTVTEIVVRIARYMLHNQAAPREIETRYREAVGWCEAIAAGTMVLDVPEAEQIAAGAPMVAPGTSLYSVESLVGFAGGTAGFGGVYAWPCVR